MHTQTRSVHTQSDIVAHSVHNIYYANENNSWICMHTKVLISPHGSGLAGADMPGVLSTGARIRWQFTSADNVVNFITVFTAAIYSPPLDVMCILNVLSVPCCCSISECRPSINDAGGVCVCLGPPCAHQCHAQPTKGGAV